MRTKVLMLGSRTIPAGRHPSRHVFFYTKKYWTNIEFEKIMSDPMKFYSYPWIWNSGDSHHNSQPRVFMYGLRRLSRDN